MKTVLTFQKELEYYRKKIDKHLEKFLNECISNDAYLKENYSWIKDYVMIGGKRLRSALIIATYKAITGKEDEKIYLASISLELLHNYTLIHDDIMDEDFTRRNNPGINRKLQEYFIKNSKDKSYNGTIFNKTSSRFIVSNAIIAGNILRCLGIKSLLESGFDKERINNALKVFNEADIIVNEGQILDIFYELGSITEKQYWNMIEKKTGNLFKACVQLGAVLGKADKKKYDNLSAYAMLAATTFQLQDDIMDIMKNDSKGHEYGSDIKKGKQTLLVIKAREKLTLSQLKSFNAIFGNPHASDKDIDTISKIFYDTNSFVYARKLALQKIQEGKNILIRSGIDRSKMDFLLGFADFMINRNK